MAPAPAPACSGTVRLHPRFAWTRSSSIQAEFDRVRSLGFTHAMVDPDPTQLAKVANAGLRAVIWGGNYDDINCAWRWSDATFSQKVQQAKSSPFAGLIDYVFVADEPHSAASGACAASPQHMRERVALSKSLLPGVPTMISENRAEDFKNLANIADVFAPIRYPCSYAKGCVLSKIDEHVAALKAAGITELVGGPAVLPRAEQRLLPRTQRDRAGAIIDRWQSSTGRPVRLHLGDSCCGDDIGLRDLPELWPVYQQKNAG